MKIYRYWALGEAPVDSNDAVAGTVRAYGGSNDGLEDALRRASEIASRAATAIAQGKPAGRYAYSDRALREEIVQEIDGDDTLSAAITRNAYGSLVLNSSRVMFVDVDYFPSGGLRNGGEEESLSWSLRRKACAGA